MANYYLRYQATGSGNGSSWANAFTTLAAVYAACAAGDTVWVADDHPETQATAMTLTSPGTASNPVKVLCVNTHTTEPPTGLATSATITTTGASAMNLTGFSYYYGITFQCASGASNSSFTLASTSAFGFVFDNCKLVLPTTSTSARLILGSAAGSSNKDCYCVLRNTTVKFSSTSQGAALGSCKLTWENTASAVDTAGSVPTTLFLPYAACPGPFDIIGVDLSALGSAKNLVSAGVTGSSAIVNIINCKLGASVSAITGTIVSAGGCEVSLIDSDSTGAATKKEFYRYGGSIAKEATLIKTSGFTDGAAGSSDKIVTLSSGASWTFPFESQKVAIPNSSTGSAKTLTIDILHDSATALTNAEIWVNVWYMGSSSYPTYSQVNDGIADVFATATDQTTSSATWTTTGMSNPNKQKLEVTFTPQMAGLIYAQVMVAKTNYTVYVDMLPVIS